MNMFAKLQTISKCKCQGDGGVQATVFFHLVVWFIEFRIIMRSMFFYHLINKQSSWLAKSSILQINVSVYQKTTETVPTSTFLFQ